jgi:hypothetical protein
MNKKSLNSEQEKKGFIILYATIVAIILWITNVLTFDWPFSN